MGNNYWVNSNSGDFIVYNDEKRSYALYLLARWEGDSYLHSEIKKITEREFLSLKGFLPIKQKKIFGHRPHYLKKKYALTQKGGIKGASKRMDTSVLDKSRMRAEILKKLLK